MIEPCMSCGEDRRLPAPSRCKHQRNHRVSTPEAPRTWTLWRTTDMRWMSGDNDDIGGPREVVEKAPVDAERERLLDVIERLEDEVGTDEDGMPWPSAFDAVNLLREYGRLGRDES